MDKSTACHNIATVAAKTYVDTNFPEYKLTGYASLVEDLTAKYLEAYKIAENQLKDSSTSKVKVLDKSKLGL